MSAFRSSVTGSAFVSGIDLVFGGIAFFFGGVVGIGDGPCHQFASDIVHGAGLG